MIKIIVEPEKFKKFLQEILIAKGGKPTLESITVKLEENGIKVEDARYNIRGIIAQYNKEYFDSFETDEEEITFTSDLLDWTNHFRQEKMTVETDEENIILKDATGQYFKTPLITQTIYPIPLKFEVKDGILLPKDREPIGIYSMDRSDINILKTSDPFILKMNKDGLNFLYASETVEFFKPLNCKVLHFNGNDDSVKLDGSYFFQFVDILEGEIILTIYKKAIVISSKKEDRVISYILSTMKED